MSAHRHLDREAGRLRTGTWRGDPHTAQLVTAHGRPSERSIRAALADLAAAGYHAAVTAALAPPEQAPFLQAGFQEHERLHLLRRGVDDLPDAPPVPLRRVRRSDRTALLALDERAFPPFWHLDEAGLDDAVAATPSARLRVASGPEDDVIGYAITGRASSRGYLQRLAVDPERQRAGVGTALVVDGLRWLRRWGAREVLVNTQEANTVALRLYEALGFRREPEGLAVLRCALPATAAPA
jgi:ribosomal protein S18 acetylase RimI-like enzyme